MKELYVSDLGITMYTVYTVPSDGGERKGEWAEKKIAF